MVQMTLIETKPFEVETVDYHCGPMMNPREFEPITPGEILREEFLVPLHLTTDQLAQGLQVSAELVQQLLDGQRPITAALVLRLGLFFQMEALFWLNLQASHDLLCVQHARLSHLQQEVKPWQVTSINRESFVTR